MNRLAKYTSWAMATLAATITLLGGNTGAYPFIALTLLFWVMGRD